MWGVRDYFERLVGIFGFLVYFVTPCGVTPGLTFRMFRNFSWGVVANSDMASREYYK